MHPKLLAVPALALVIAGCGTSSDAGVSAPTTGPGFPVSMQNCGRALTVEHAPERIVSLNQGSTETLLSLGVANRVVGTAGWTDPVLSTLATDNEGISRLADWRPSVEAVLDRAPDLVAASFRDFLGPGGVTTPEDLEKLGVPSYISAIECTKEAGNSDGARDETLQIDAIYTEIRDLGALVGEPERAEELINEMQDRVAAASAADTSGTSVLYWFANAETPYMAGCCGGPGIINRTLGLTNVFEDSAEDWPGVTWEAVAERDPDVQILGDLPRKSQTAESAEAKIAFLESNPVTREMTAVKNKHYIALAGAELNPSVRIAVAVEKVSAGLQKFGFTR